MRQSPPTKWEVYEQILRVLYYVVFSRYTDEVRYFELRGCRYQEIQPREQRLWLPDADLGVGFWHGVFQGVERLHVEEQTPGVSSLV